MNSFFKSTPFFLLSTTFTVGAPATDLSRIDSPYYLQSGIDNLLYVYTTYKFINDIRLRNKDREDLYIIENNTLYGRGGLKFSIL